MNFLTCYPESAQWVTGCANLCIPAKIGSIVSIIYKLIQVAVPIILIISGMLTLAKSMTKQSEDDVKKAQKLLIQKFIAAAIIFLLFSLTSWIIKIADDDKSDRDSVLSCFNALISGDSTSDGGGVGTDRRKYLNAENKCIELGFSGLTRIYYINSNDTNGAFLMCYNKIDEIDSNKLKEYYKNQQIDKSKVKRNYFGGNYIQASNGSIVQIQNVDVKNGIIENYIVSYVEKINDDGSGNETYFNGIDITSKFCGKALDTADGKLTEYSVCYGSN